MTRRQQIMIEVQGELETEDLDKVEREKVLLEIQQRNNAYEEAYWESVRDDHYYDEPFSWVTDGCPHGRAHDESCDACWQEDEAINGPLTNTPDPIDFEWED